MVVATILGGVARVQGLGTALQTWLHSFLSEHVGAMAMAVFILAGSSVGAGGAGAGGTGAGAQCGLRGVCWGCPTRTARTLGSFQSAVSALGLEASKSVCVLFRNGFSVSYSSLVSSTSFQNC